MENPISKVEESYEQFLWTEEMFHGLVEAVQDAILLVNDSGKIIYGNKAAHSIYGFDPDEIIGKSVMTIIPEGKAPDYQKEFQSVISSAENKKSVERIVTRGCKKDGTQISIDLAISSRTIDGKNYIFLSARDLSDVRAVKKRALLQDRLAAVGQLAAGIAHDFNNILVPITLYCELLLNDHELKPKARKHIQTILEQAERAASLTQQFLDFSRKGIIEPRYLDLHSFLIELSDLLAGTLPKNIRFILDHDLDDYSVNADPVRMQQIFVNLALNARDAMPYGGTLQFVLSRLNVGENKPPYRDMHAGTWIQIQVIDTGMGISPEHLPHVFEPFFTTKPSGQGTGLGLSQVYGIVKQHGGYIDVKSTLGEGTEFIIYLPGLDRSVKNDFEDDANQREVIFNPDK